MKSIKHCSGRLKKRLAKAGYLQSTVQSHRTDPHALVARSIADRWTWFRRLWWSKPGDGVTLRTAAIRAGLLPRRFCR